MEELLRELTFSDLRLLQCLRGEKSLRAVARTINMEPAAISKRMTRIEELFAFEIVKRSPRGFVFTGEGEQLVRKAELLLKNAEDVFGAGRPRAEFDRILTIGSRGFLNILLTMPFLDSAKTFSAKTRLRFIDMSPQELQRAATAGALDIAVHFEELEWTPSWTSIKTDNLAWKLIARVGHPLKTESSLSDVLKYPFIGPGSWTGDQLVTGADGFPVPWQSRIPGHEVQTALNALRIICGTDQLVFLPALLAHEFLMDDHVKIIEVSDVPSVEKAIHISVHSDRVSQREFMNLVGAVRNLIKSSLPLLKNK